MAKKDILPTYEPIKLVPVIASYDSSGHVRPLYIRVGEDSYKVESYWVVNYFSTSLIFKCKIIVHDYLKPIELTYHIKEMVWSIPDYDKMVETDRRGVVKYRTK